MEKEGRMSRQYRAPLGQVTLVEGAPASFTWRGVERRVVALLAQWRLRDRWWAGAPDADPAPPADQALASDRHYYRVECADGLLCELYWDAAQGLWVLDRTLD
jgi:hypothetical protein